MYIKKWLLIAPVHYSLRIVKILSITLCFLFSYQVFAQREIILNTTGYGFDRTTANGINDGQWEYIQKFANLKYQGQDAGVTAVRLHIEWNQYEPTQGAYQGAKINAAVKAILALNPQMKIALHFPYMRPGYWNDFYLQESDVAQLANGDLVRENIAFSTPSIYSDNTSERFQAFVHDALNNIREYYPKLLYVAMGNTSTEEFYIPNVYINNSAYQGMYEQKAADAWRNKFLPAQFPNQTIITWDNNQYERSNAPMPTVTDENFNSDMRRDFHRFAAWGLLRVLKGFNDAVKRTDSSIKVLDFVSDFGSIQGNLRHLHNSSIPLALELTDGIYSSEGSGQYDNWRKIMALDCIKGTNPNKIAAIEFDPDDLGGGSPQSAINEGLIMEYLPRAFKHGANYVHLAMHYNDQAMNQTAHAIAICKAQFINSNYTPPARSASVVVNTFPKVFTEGFLFEQWNQIGGDNWGVTDNAPKSIKMIDKGYWQNVWSTSNLLPCNFNVTASSSQARVLPGTQITLTANCSGGECDGATFTWNGNGVNNITGQSITISSPNSDNTYNYSVASDRSGCGAKTSQIAVIVQTSLPVTLVRFSAVKAEKAVSLNWSTSQEVNSDHFEVERSQDGKTWNKLGDVSASGETSKIITQYTYLDPAPANGENLYRLKMVDRDQTYGYSRIVNVNAETESFFTVFPNPVSEKLNINTTNWKQIQTVEILNNSGQIIYKSASAAKPEVNVQDLSEGIYFVRLTHKDGKKETNKFVKKE